MRNKIQKLAENLVNYSIKLNSKEKVLIEASVGAQPLVEELVKEIFKKNAYPFVKINNKKTTRHIIGNANKEYFELCTKYMKPVMEDMDAYIGISADDNIYEMSDISSTQMQLYSLLYSQPIHSEIRVPKTKWVILKYPTSSFAQLANMSDENFEIFYFNVCNLNYQKMNDALTPLKELMEKTDKVRLIAPSTDLTFSIKNMNAVKCAGEMNIPDGEIYTAPVKDSVNGTITFNVPTMYSGKRFDNISLKFENGKIVDASCSSGGNLSLNKILDTDDGSRYVGEFAIGVNPYITQPMLDILFDEKITGSIHFTPGCCYDDANNGNISAVHWDLVLNQTKEAGGGEIWFDDVLVRKDGIFVLDELKVLNPENLK